MMFFIKNNIILIATLFVTALLFAILILHNFNKLKIFSEFISKTFQIMFKVIKEPILFIIQIIRFKIKEFYLSYKLTLKLKNKDGVLLTNILLNFCLLVCFGFILLYILYENNDKTTDILLMLEGAIISIWITHLWKIIYSIYDFSQNLNRLFTTISSMLQAFSTMYEFFIGFFPYGDDLFKKDENILYITPYGHNDGKVLQEKSAFVFLNYLQSLPPQKLFDSFDEKNSRELANLLEKQQKNLYSIHSFVISSKMYLPNNLIGLYEQVLSVTNNIVSFYSIYKNLDTQLKSNISKLFTVYIIKLTNTILLLQKEQSLYKDYITHISYPPQLIYVDSLRKATELNKH